MGGSRCWEMRCVVHVPLGIVYLVWNSEWRVSNINCQAHAMLPHLGAGAGQGIEDAAMLAALLGNPQTTSDNIEVRLANALNTIPAPYQPLVSGQCNLQQVLKVYDEIRRPRGQAVCDGAVEAGRIYGGHGKSGPTPEGMAKDLAGMWDFVWYHEVEDDVRKAVGLLCERGVFSSSSL